MRTRALLPLGLLVLLLPVPAVPQYLFLDTNGDGVHDATDQLAPSGPTTVDIYVVTDRNRDGTAVGCNVPGSGESMTINSYTVVLHSVGGSVRWGPMQNRLPFTTPFPACFATYEDTTGANWYHNGWGWMDYFPAGKHLVATMQIETVSGQPSIFVEKSMPTPWKLTQFGSKCPAKDDDNTYKLGYDFFDADGLGPLAASAGGPYEAQADRELLVDGTGSRSMTGEALTYHWDFGDGSTANTAIAGHTYADPGDYTIVLTVQSASESDTDVTTAHIVATQAPFARINGPVAAYVDIPVTFDGSASYDPDMDILQYTWTFGDGGRDTGTIVHHTYSIAGEMSVELVVSDGLLHDRASRSITVYGTAHPPVAVPGGPYTGIVDQTVMFHGTGSSDPDGDPLQYVWGFGDRHTGLGVITGHAYTAPGVYTVMLTVNDGGLSNSATTSATIAGSVPARAFVEGGAVFVPGQGTAMTVHVETAGDSYRLDEIALWPMMLQSNGTGTVAEINSVADATVSNDIDHNGKNELTFTFSPEELALLFGTADPGATVTAQVKGSFDKGGYFTADLPVHIGSPEAASGPLRISPNPFNPEALVSFSTSVAGPVRAHLFDVHGRLVRTIVHAPMPAGRHTLTLDARNDGGALLASGIYFLRLASPDGVVTRRVAIAK